jgi:triacylglycerol lipase
LLSALALSCIAGPARAAQAPPAAVDTLKPPVVLVHGLALSSLWMHKLAKGLEKAGYRACAIDYPSRDYSIDTLAVHFIAPSARRCFPRDSVIHFVTHSMGGILLRRLETVPGAPRIGRSVMIAPPNRGSEIVDVIGEWLLFDLWNGPAGSELGTGVHSVPNRLGEPRFEFGVIAANRSAEPLFSEWIPGPDDGKVAVASTKLESMRDFIEIADTHTFVLWNDETVRQTVAFLKTGAFARKTAK